MPLRLKENTHVKSKCFILDFTRCMYVANKPSRPILTHFFKSQPQNMIIACDNPTISPHIATHFECELESHWLTVAKHQSEILRMDLVVLMNTYCSVKSQEQVWDLYYFCPPSTSPSTVRSSMLYEEECTDSDNLD